MTRFCSRFKVSPSVQPKMAGRPQNFAWNAAGMSITDSKQQLYEMRITIIENAHARRVRSELGTGLRPLAPLLREAYRRGTRATLGRGPRFGTAADEDRAATQSDAQRDVANAKKGLTM